MVLNLKSILSLPRHAQLIMSLSSLPKQRSEFPRSHPYVTRLIIGAPFLQAWPVTRWKYWKQVWQGGFCFPSFIFLALIFCLCWVMQGYSGRNHQKASLSRPLMVPPAGVQRKEPSEGGSKTNSVRADYNQTCYSLPLQTV